MKNSINWNNYLYSGNGYSLIDELDKFKQIRLASIPQNSAINKYGMSRIRYYGGFTPWTNIPIAEKHGGNI